MAKSLNKESLISFERNRLEEKIKEFQDYLEDNTIINKITNNKLKQVDPNVDRHKEIDVQIKMINALFTWLPALEKLRSVDGKEFEARGGAEINGMFASNKE
jgi:hypothetical protein